MARELGGETPLVETEGPKTRLVGEDQDASDDEDEKRISFSAVKNKSQRQKIAEEIGTIMLLRFFADYLQFFQLVVLRT